MTLRDFGPPRVFVYASSFIVMAGLMIFADFAYAQVEVKESERGAVVMINGQFFTEYWRNFNGTPILWPIIGPTGKPVTRNYPMAKAPGEREDHPHHRSLWFGHGDVNGLSYWHREEIRHRQFELLESGTVGKIVTRNDWLDPKGNPICEDRRFLRFGTEGKARWIDFVITITARYGPVRFGDTKEGIFALRVAETIKVDANLGGKIINSEGQVNQEAWGKKALWVDYYGPIDGEIVGIAVMNHPSSFRFPTFWHVRTYGLFAANPFGVRDFTGSGDGSFELKEGETIRLAYRVWIHPGDTETAGVAQAYERFAREELK